MRSLIADLVRMLRETDYGGALNLNPQKARAVAEGRVTQHREPVTPKRTRYRVGETYPVQPAGREHICRVRITDLREERLGDVTHRDARAMGYRNTAAFKAAWLADRDPKWFQAWQGSNLAMLDRFTGLHAHKPVMVISFQLATDIPRFLTHPGPNQGDYTEQHHRAIDDLEAIDKTTQQRFSRAAEAFCLGAQLESARRQQEDRAKRKAERGRSMRLPPTQRRAA